MIVYFFMPSTSTMCKNMQKWRYPSKHAAYSLQAAGEAGSFTMPNLVDALCLGSEHIPTVIKSFLLKETADIAGTIYEVIVQILRLCRTTGDRSISTPLMNVSKITLWQFCMLTEIGKLTKKINLQITEIGSENVNAKQWHNGDGFWVLELETCWHGIETFSFSLVRRRCKPIKHRCFYSRHSCPPNYLETIWTHLQTLCSMIWQWKHTWSPWFLLRKTVMCFGSKSSTILCPRSFSLLHSSRLMKFSIQTHPAELCI